MTSRDTHDIEEYAREKSRMQAVDEAHREYELTGNPPKILRSINVQPRMVAELLAQSEPCLFANRSPVAVKPYELPPLMAVAYALMYDVARWHASLQVSFDRSLGQDAPTEGALV